MSTGALITMLLTWGYVLFFVTYFFVKVVRKQREAEQAEARQQPEESNEP